MQRLSTCSLVLALVGTAGCPAKSDEAAKPGSQVQTRSVAAPLPGVRIVYAAALPDDKSEAALDHAVKTIGARLAAMSLNGKAAVRIDGATIVVDMPGVDADTAARATRTLKRRGRLTFQLVDSADELTKRLHDHAKQDNSAAADGVSASVEQWNKPGTQQPVHDYFLTARDRTLQLSAAEARLRGCFDASAPTVAGKVACKLTGATVLAQYIERTGGAAKPLAADADHAFVYELVRPRGPSDPPMFWRSYYVHKDAKITGASIAKARSVMDPRSHRSSVLVELNEDGKARFADLTDKNVGRKVAIVIDGEVMTAPLIQTEVPGGVVAISMGKASLGATRREASDIAAILGAGSMPVTLTVKSITELATEPLPASE